VTETVQNFYALASLVMIAGVIVLLAATVAEVFGRNWLTTIASVLAGWELALGFTIAAFATAGSLYFSEVANYVPCPLCWYQRIAMYPLVVVLGLAALRRDRGAALYGLALSAIGAMIATYHYQLEWFPDQAAICKQGSLCHVIWFRVFGFATIPYLALTAFAAIASLCALCLWWSRRAVEVAEAEDVNPGGTT
jgi:disulfide bond formation protein DsbB